MKSRDLRNIYFIEAQRKRDLQKEIRDTKSMGIPSLRHKDIQVYSSVGRGFSKGSHKSLEFLVVCFLTITL